MKSVNPSSNLNSYQLLGKLVLSMLPPTPPQLGYEGHSRHFIIISVCVCVYIYIYICVYIYIYIFFFFKHGRTFFINLFIYFWLRWVFIAVHGLSLLAASGGYSSLQCVGFSLRWLLLLRSMGSRCATPQALLVAHGLSSCGSRA